jgi:CDP-diacylglycerol---serine O-phosphatidyltransferase
MIRPSRMRNVLRSSVRMPVLPTLLTLGNAVCGLASISYAASAGEPSAASNYLQIAGLFIFAGMIFDMLDGSAARWTNQSTKFGGELDSLCDAISFGVAPALIVLEMADAYPPRILWAIAALYMSCTVLRLARFNVESAASEEKHDWFSGLPSPAAAATIASFAIAVPHAPGRAPTELALRFPLTDASALSLVRNLIPLVALALACLMVSRIRYPHLAKQLLRGKRQFRQVAQIVFAIAAIVAFGELSAPLILCAFVVGAPISATWRKLGRKTTSSPESAQHLPESGEVKVPVLTARPPGRVWWSPKTRQKRPRA